MESAGNANISVDRLSIAAKEHIIESANSAARARQRSSERPRSFYGWAVVSAQDAAASGRTLQASPMADNPFHADIVLPALAQEDRDEQLRHARELADASRWRSRDEY